MTRLKFLTFLSTQKIPHWEATVVVVAILISTVLRFWGINRGLPELYVHDEVFEVHRALQLLDGVYDLNRAGKGFYFYLLTPILALDGLAAVLTGSAADFGEYVSQSIAVPGRAIFISRTLSASMGVLSCVLVYILGLRILPRRPYSPAAIAAVTWSTCGIAIWLSKWGFVETCLVLLAIIAMFPILKLQEDPRLRYYLLAAAIIGAATATKKYGMTLILLLLAAQVPVLMKKQSSKPRLKSIALRSALAVMAFTVIWLVLDPSVVVNWLRKLQLMPGLGPPPSSSDLTPTSHLMFYTRHLRWIVGNLLAPLAVFGLVAAFWKKNWLIASIGLYGAIYLLLLGLTKTGIHVYPRYLLISVPFVILTGVYGLVCVFDWLGENSKFNMPVIMISVLAWTVAVFSAWSGINSLFSTGFYRELEPVETQTLAWFSENIPEGSRVVVKGEEVWPGNQTIPLYATSSYYQDRYEQVLTAKKYLKNQEALPHLAKARGIRRYDLTVVDRYEEWAPLEDYLDQGIEYFVIHVEQFTDSHPENRSRKAWASRIRIYDELRGSPTIVTLAGRFSGFTLQGAPKTIEIFRTVPPSGAG